MKAFRSEFSLGFNSFSKAHQLVKQHKVFWLYLLAPVVLNIILFIFIIIASINIGNSISNWFYNLVGLSNADLTGLSFIKEIIVFVFALLVKLLVVLIYMASYKYIILILLAPVLALISEKVEEIITGNRFPFTIKQFVSDVLRGMMLAIKNGFIELLFTLLFISIGFIPIVGFSSPILIFLVSSYYYGFSMIDYYNERKRLSVKASSQFIWKHKGLALSNGMLFNFLVFGSASIFAFLPFVVSIVLQYVLMIPIVLLSVASIYSCIAATIAGLQVDGKLSNKSLYAKN